MMGTSEQAGRRSFALAVGMAAMMGLACGGSGTGSPAADTVPVAQDTVAPVDAVDPCASCAPGQTCVAGSCSTVGQACSSVIACAQECDDMPCVSACRDEGTAAGQRQAQQVIACVASACGNYDPSCWDQALALACSGEYHACLVSCDRSCSGKSCGADGCGATCGTCEDGATCDAGGQCEAPPTTACGQCPAGTTCGAGSEHPSWCKGPGCASGLGWEGECVLGGNVVQWCDAQTSYAIDCSQGDKTCAWDDEYSAYNCVASCAPQCANANCGPDGCGGTCGTCGPGTECHPETLQCEAPLTTACGKCPAGTTCGAVSEHPSWCKGPGCAPGLDWAGECALGGDVVRWCDAQETYAIDCSKGGGTCAWDDEDSVYDCVCAPQCANAKCGPDGCGGTCGTCGPGTVCHPETFQCVAECVPSCTGKACGPDGCGGVCGACPGPQDACIDGHCECQPTCISTCGNICPTGSAGCGTAACEPYAEDGCGGECRKCRCVLGSHCDRCDGHDDCAVGHACESYVDYPAVGKFCFKTCWSDDDCPSDASCDGSGPDLCVPDRYETCAANGQSYVFTTDACGHALRIQACSYACENGACVSGCGWMTGGCSGIPGAQICCDPGAVSAQHGACCQSCIDSLHLDPYTRCCDGIGDCWIP